MKSGVKPPSARDKQGGFRRNRSVVCLKTTFAGDQNNSPASIQGNIMKTKSWIAKTIRKIAISLCVLTASLIFGGCGKPDAPLSFSFRGSAMDASGLVLQVQNTGDKHLSCRMWAVNSVQNQARDYSFDLGPYQKTEIGILECNWSFKTGEGVTIRTEGFQDFTFNVP